MEQDGDERSEQAKPDPPRVRPLTFQPSTHELHPAPQQGHSENRHQQQTPFSEGLEVVILCVGIKILA